MTTSSMDAALIAGGKSSRFGNLDKAFIDWQGEPLWVHQLRKLAQLKPNRIWLSTNPTQNYPDYIDGVTQIHDQTPDLGPIGALQTLLKNSQADRLLVLAVDLPLMDVQFMQRLACKNGAVVMTEYGWEPLAAAIYPRESMLHLVEEAIAKKQLSLQKLLGLAADKAIIEPASIETFQHCLTNINTQAELDQIHQREQDQSITLRRYRCDTKLGDPETDYLAREEPLELRVNDQSVSVMMRTPGHDHELAVGFLYTESVIRSANEIVTIEACPDIDIEATGNVLNVRLQGDRDLTDLTRHVFTSSSCGICGKATIESVFQSFPPITTPTQPNPEVILSLPEKLRSNQDTFEKTGGLHASALFNLNGDLLLLREDVGRHNALDKVIGYALQNTQDLSESILLVSGRLSFELMQKAVAANIPIVAGISAPSSLAVELANQSGVTLIGFLRESSFNVYS